MAQKASLPKLPNVALEQIFRNLDFLEIQPVRKVCQNLRSYIDNHHRSDSNLKYVSISVERGKFTVSYNFFDERNKLSVVYENLPGGCFVRSEINGMLRETTASWDDVSYLKEKFLLDPNREYFEIKFNISNCGDQLNLLFGPPFFLVGRYRRCRRMWFFRTENPSQVLAIRLYSGSIDLQRMDVTTIPADARIND
ncbi:hypothetical protein GCK72_019701 [Caenorhabditis remanei]|uniref:F-box domain-containing protein n=1 Tax=Caenorhabditis remanei TaxID=31234 RepID=A0A6A5GEN0_CAERE|nr:hypothetical protein GCK72_019701 [Caenorhabditis remanei]KAF1753145.1 hypothetical protein GCK72_019701 [Caenorhabditis remanei]